MKIVRDPIQIVVGSDIERSKKGLNYGEYLSYLKLNIEAKHRMKYRVVQWERTEDLGMWTVTLEALVGVQG